MAIRYGWLATAAGNGFLAVAAGAFGAHGLAELPERYLNAFKTGAAYQMYHALALLAVALLPASRVANVAGWGFLLGVVVFSGSLYALALTEVGVFGAITPIGGMLLLVGWAGLAFAALAGKRRP